MVSNDQTQILQIPLVSTYYFLEAMSEFNGKISDFIGRYCHCITITIATYYYKHMRQNMVFVGVLYIVFLA